jgi:hypothetical protein
MIEMWLIEGRRNCWEVAGKMLRSEDWKYAVCVGKTESGCVVPVYQEPHMFETDKERLPFFLCRAAAEGESRLLQASTATWYTRGLCDKGEASLSIFILIL